MGSVAQQTRRKSTSLNARVHGLANDALGWAPQYALVFAATVAFYVFKKIGCFQGDNPALQGPVILLGVAWLWPVKMSELAASYRFALRSVLLLFGFYSLVAYNTLTPVYFEDDLFLRLFFVEGRYLVIATALVAWWRPGFGLITLFYAAWKKHIMAQLYGFSLNSTDYYTVCEFGIFMVLGAGVIRACQLLDARQPGQAWSSALSRKGWSGSEAIFLAALALHLANYFYSGFEKLILPGADLTTWALENKTYYITLSTLAHGLGPLHSSEAAKVAYMELARQTYPVTNILVLLAQLCAPLALLRLRWAIILTFFYDIMHLTIFFASSILFWKWMTLNAGLIGALGAMGRKPDKPKQLPWPLLVMSFGFLFLSPLVFDVNRLGWFDCASSNIPVIYALTDDGEEVRVPTNFYLEASANLAKSRVGYPFEGHFEGIGTFGKALAGYEKMLEANQCAIPVGEASNLAKSFEEDPRLPRFFEQHHAFVLKRVDDDGRYPYFIYPHHNWSNPSLFEAFSALDLRTVAAYRYEMRSVCTFYRAETKEFETINRLTGSVVIDVNGVKAPLL